MIYTSFNSRSVGFQSGMQVCVNSSVEYNFLRYKFYLGRRFKVFGGSRFLGRLKNRYNRK